MVGSSSDGIVRANLATCAARLCWGLTLKGVHQNPPEDRPLFCDDPDDPTVGGVDAELFFWLLPDELLDRELALLNDGML